MICYFKNVLLLITGGCHEIEQTLRMRQEWWSVNGVHHYGPTCFNLSARSLYNTAIYHFNYLREETFKCYALRRRKLVLNRFAANFYRSINSCK